MAQGKLEDYEQKRGDLYPIEVVFDNVTGDLTGATAKLTVNSLPSPGPDDAPEFEIVGTITGPKTAEFIPQAADVDRVGQFFYEVQIVGAAGYRYSTGTARFTFGQDLVK